MVGSTSGHPRGPFGAARGTGPCIRPDDEPTDTVCSYGPSARPADKARPVDGPVHPLSPEINGCHHVYLAAPGSDAGHSRHAMVIHPGMFDRSPCGTGTSARMAQLHARGELALDTDFDNESFIGTHFTGRLVEEGVLGGPAATRGLTTVIPTVEGRAWITGTAQYHYDPDDPFPEGFEL